MRSDIRSSFCQPCGAQGLGVCAVFRAGVELHLLPGRSVCGAADLPCRNGRGGFTTAAEDGVESLGDGAGGVKRVWGSAAVHLRNVWEYAAGVLDRWEWDSAPGWAGPAPG